MQDTDFKPKHNRKNSLLWALPYLAFMLPFIYELMHQSLTPRVVTIWVVLIVFVGLYTTSWISFNIFPCHLDYHLLAVVLCLLGLNFALGFLTGVGEVCYFLMYICSVVIFLAPQKYLFSLMGLVLLEFLVIVYLFPFSSFYWALIVLCAGTFVTIVSRHSIQTALDRELALAEIEYRSAEQERNRVSAQLHDALGQTLTTISLNADLTVKQLQIGQIKQVEQSATMTTQLSRQALAEVRRVVRQNYTLNFSEEVNRAQELLGIANIQLSLHNIDELPQDLENMAAWMLREGTSNIIHHSTADRVWLVANHRGIALINNGREVNTTMPHSGNGLKGLQARCDASISLKWGKLDISRWEKWLGEHSLLTHNSGFILELTLKEYADD